MATLEIVGTHALQPAFESELGKDELAAGFEFARRARKSSRSRGEAQKLDRIKTFLDRGIHLERVVAR